MRPSQSIDAASIHVMIDPHAPTSFNQEHSAHRSIIITSQYITEQKTNSMQDLSRDYERKNEV
jgi:hypothetical protein